MARRAAARRPHVPEPALRGLAGPVGQDHRPRTATTRTRTTTGDLQAGDGPAAGRPDEPLIEGTGQITAKIGQARALAEEDPDLPEIPPEMAAHAADQLAERRRQFFDAYTDVDIPEDELNAVLAMLAAPGGMSTGAAAEALGLGRTTAHRYLTRLAVAGHAEVRGRGRGAGSTPPAPRPAAHLHRVPPPQRPRRR